MELRDYIRTLRKNWIIILVLAVVGAGASAAYTLTQTPEYRATSEVFVSTDGSGSAGEQLQGQNYTRARVVSYVELASRPIVLDPAIESLGLDTTARELASSVLVTNPVDTTVLTITVTNEDPQLAADIANTISASLSSVVASVERSSDGAEAPVRISPIAEATPPNQASSPRVARTVLLGAVLGLAIGLAVALLRSTLDTRVRTSRDVEALTDAPVIGAIPMDPESSARPLVMQAEPQSAPSEAFRSLRTNLQFLDLDDDRKVFAVTSSMPGEGKSTTVANLAIALADAGINTALIDGDLRKPRVASYFGIEGGVGLTDVLVGRVQAEDVFQQWGDRPLLILPAGKTPPNPSELLASTRMQSLLTTVSQAADVVLIDCPPLLPVTDAAVLARETNGAIIAVASGRTKNAQLTQALENVEHVGAKVAGIALTMVPTKGADAPEYGYGYGEEAS